MDKLSKRELIAYSLGFSAVSFINLGIGTYLTYFWTDVALVPIAAIGTILLISRFFDGGTDIAMGFIVDRTESKYGKARPWLLRMLIPGVLSMILLFYAPNLSDTGKIAYAFVTYNLVAFFFLTAIALPLQSLTSLITTKPKDRLMLNMSGQSFSTAATVIGNMFILQLVTYFGGGKQGYSTFFTILAIIAGLFVFITFSGTKERSVRPVTKKVEKLKASVAIKAFVSNKWWIIVTLLQGFTMAYPAMMAINIYYMIWIMKDPTLMGPFMSTIFTAMLITLIVFTPIVPRVGKINAGFFGMFIQIAGGLMPLLAPGNYTVMMISAAFRGIGPAMLLGTRLAFMADVVEYGEWKTGVRIEGLVYSGASMGAKIGTGLGGAFVAYILSSSGYIGGAATQAAETLSAITFTFTWGHAIVSALITACLFFLRGLEKQMPQIMEDLQKRNQEEVVQ